MPLLVRYEIKGIIASNMHAINKKNMVLIGTISGLRLCSKYLTMLAKIKDIPMTKQALWTKSDTTETGSIKLDATPPKPCLFSAAPAMTGNRFKIKKK